MARQVRLCKNQDGNKHYAKGYCQACYMRVYRNGEAPTPADENIDEIDAPIATKEELDQALTDTASRLPTFILSTAPRDDDTEGVREMRRRLAAQLYLARREVIRQMLSDGYENWQIKNEFLSRPELFNQFIKLLKNPDRTLDEDIQEVLNSGRLDLHEQYIDGLKRQLRRANAFAENTALTAKERATWATKASEIQRNLAIAQGVIHVVPGRGDIPTGGGDWDDPDEDKPLNRDEASLPDVEDEKEYGDDLHAKSEE